MGTLGITFEGREIRCQRGLSIAAALTAAGELELRNAGTGERRGLFCGMGVCQECRVRVAGRGDVRACMTAVAEAMCISRLPERAVPEEAFVDESGKADDLPEAPDLLVLGGGPGGLMAASVAAEAGAEVVLVDERPGLGGQFFKQPATEVNPPPSLAHDRQFARGRALIERARRSGARLLSGAEVWGAFAPNELTIMHQGRGWSMRPKRTIVATGAYERGLPVPGWTLPGVMTTGAAQTLLRSYGVIGGKRVLVAGNGPLNLQVALELQRAGATVVAVAESARRPGLTSIGDALGLLLASPRLAIDGLGYLAGLRRAKVPVLYGQALQSVRRVDGALRATLLAVGAACREPASCSQANGQSAGQAGGPTDATMQDTQVSGGTQAPDESAAISNQPDQTPDRADVAPESCFDVDVVCVGYGFQPGNEVLRCLGCRHDHAEQRGHLVTVRDEHCETTVAGVYAVGDCCGLGGAPAAIEEGMIAATAAARSLRLEVPPEMRRECNRATRRLRRHRRFQTALWRLFKAPRLQTELASPDTPICRCENVRLSDLHAALEQGDSSIAMLKRRTRLGMGPCQGRYCAPVAASLIARHTGQPMDEFSLFAPRVPIKPVRIGDIVGAAGVPR